MVEWQLPKLHTAVRFRSPALKFMKYFITSILLLFYILNLTGCATSPITTLPATPGIPLAGTYHRVEKGETLWKISKQYNLDIDELAKINRITDTKILETGQMLLIPDANKEALLTPTDKKFFSDDFSWPLKGKIISYFGQSFDNMLNKGINIKPYSDRSITASRAGKVIFCSQNFSGFGKTIIIDHHDGFLTIYARNSELMVKTGDTVEKGMLIAKAGSAGRDKNTFLHFEIRKGHTAQNPCFYLP